jgi:hypothetical protein
MKKQAVKVFIQKAEFSSLGYAVETEDQREMVKRIASGEETKSDSPETQLELHRFLRLYLFEHATPINLSGLPEHHSESLEYRTKSDGAIMLDNTLGWSTIFCNKRGAIYLENLLREKGYSVITSKEAISG